MKKRCVICGEWFPLNHPMQTTCSVTCRKERQKRYDKQRNRYIQIQINAKRLKKKCVICGKRFPLKHSKYTTCSVACQKERNKRYNKQYWLHIKQNVSLLEKTKARVNERLKIKKAADPEFRKRLYARKRKWETDRRKDPKYLERIRVYHRKAEAKRRSNPEYLSKKRAYRTENLERSRAINRKADAKRRSNPEYLSKKRAYGRTRRASDSFVRCITNIQAVASTIGKALSSTSSGRSRL